MREQPKRQLGKELPVNSIQSDVTRDMELASLRNHQHQTHSLYSRNRQQLWCTLLDADQEEKYHY